jgi:hypothetical protein
MTMLSIQTILLTSCLLIIAGMLASLAWLSALRRPAEAAPAESGADRF